MDIDAERLGQSKLVAEKLIATLGAPATVTTTTSQREAVDGADFVICAFQIGGFEPATRVDFDVPKQFGLEQTIADLKSVRGDLGVQSGLIATNSGELEALKRLGERNYFEFDISKSKDPTRVGRIQVRLRDTNHNKGRFNIDVLADDKTISKKNKTLLEPIQFYVMGVKRPYEIVVNKLEKNRIVGYLATPLDEDPSRKPVSESSSE